MKKINIVLLYTCLLPIMAVGQVFDDPSNVWVGSGTDLQSNVLTPVTYYIDGDTTINEIDYRQVYAYDSYYEFADTIYYGAVREANDKVWFIPGYTAVPGEPVLLLYDWTKTVGDTLRYQPVSGSDSYWLWVAVSSDSVQLINGEMRERLQIQGSGYSGANNLVTTFDAGELINRIGHIQQGPFNSLDINRISGLDDILLYETGPYRCFSQNGQLLWMNEEISDCNDLLIVMSTEESLAEPLVSLIPNPVENILRLSWSGENNWKEIVAWNTQGHRVHTQVVLDGELSHSLDTSLWPKGLYFIVLTDEEGGRLTRKVVRQ